MKILDLSFCQPEPKTQFRMCHIQDTLHFISFLFLSNVHAEQNLGDLIFAQSVMSYFIFFFSSHVSCFSSAERVYSPQLTAVPLISARHKKPKHLTATMRANLKRNFNLEMGKHCDCASLLSRVVSNSPNTSRHWCCAVYDCFQ